MSPAAAPTASIRPCGPGRSGTKAAIRSSKRSVPRAWLHSATFGFQPPETSSRSASTVSWPRPSGRARSRRTPSRPSSSAAGADDRPRRAGRRPRRRSRPRPRAGRVATASVVSLVVKIDGPVARPDAVPLDVGRGRAREHDPGPVVVGEDDRPLGGAGREHDPAGPDVPQPALGPRRRAALDARSRSRGRRPRARSCRRGRRRRRRGRVGVQHQHPRDRARAARAAAAAAASPDAPAPITSTSTWAYALVEPARRRDWSTSRPFARQRPGRAARPRAPAWSPGPSARTRRRPARPGRARSAPRRRRSSRPRGRSS